MSENFGKNVIHRALDPEKDEEIIDIVKDEIKTILSKEWSYDDMAVIDTFRAEKKNQRVQKFVQRMQDEVQREQDDDVEDNIYTAPQNCEKFKFVYVKKEQPYDLRGRKVAVPSSYYMELLEIAKLKNLEIDVGKYIDSEIMGLSSQMIAFYPEFKDETDTRERNNARKYLTKFYQEYTGKSLELDEAKVFSNSKKKQFRDVAKTLKPFVESKLGKLYPIYNKFNLSTNLGSSGYKKQPWEIIKEMYITDTLQNDENDTKLAQDTASMLVQRLNKTPEEIGQLYFDRKG